MFIGIIEVSEPVKDTGEDVRCHLYGGKTQTWRLFLTVANTRYEFNTGIYLQISKPAEPKLCLICELEEAESVLPKTNKCVCWNSKTPRLSVDKLLVVTPITMAVKCFVSDRCSSLFQQETTRPCRRRFSQCEHWCCCCVAELLHSRLLCPGLFPAGGGRL